MNPLIKKEIRLLLPSWAVAVLLAMVQGVTRPYDFYVASLLFFGLTIMALTTIGREASLNTFSSLVALPAERIRIWQTKLSVLAGAFLIVFVVWLAAFGIAFRQSTVDLSDRENSYNLFITICLIATATFTGGLWTTLLLRQLAGAFWLTLLVPATLSGFSAIFLAGRGESDHLVVAVLSVVIGVYSVAGFLFARWLFFHAQDVGWSGVVIALPEWKFLSARAGMGLEVRKRRPIFALLKKELRLQQGVLTGAVGLLVVHASFLGLRVVHQFPKNSAGEGAGEMLTSIVWMLWLVLPVLLGSIAVAEERKAGVMESQLCLPASRRIQFVIKACVTLGLGVFLGGVMPTMLESIGLAVGSQNQLFMSDNHLDQDRLRMFLYGTMGFSAWTALVGLFASSQAKSFLQAIGIGLVTFVGLMLVVPVFSNTRMFFFDSIAAHSILPLIVAIPTIIVTLLWLTWLNFKDFRDGWLLWRRNLLGAAGALVFIGVGSAAIYHRAWEVFEPVEPAHGPAKFSMANPPRLRHDGLADEFMVQLPDGRVWFDRFEFDASRNGFRDLIRASINPFPTSTGPQQFSAVSNWISAVVWQVNPRPDGTGHTTGYFETVGVRADGTLWVSDQSFSQHRTGDRLMRYGDETNWQAVSRPYQEPSVVLLKNDGTLWCWGAGQWAAYHSVSNLLALREFSPYRVDTNSNWHEIAPNGCVAEKTDGSVWEVGSAQGKGAVSRATNYDQVDLQKISHNWHLGEVAYVRKDGTLWLCPRQWRAGKWLQFAPFPIGAETNWYSVAAAGWGNSVVALKSDGTLWEWGAENRFSGSAKTPPTRLGIHHDWVALAAVQDGAVALAADGSVWFWPDREIYDHGGWLMRAPKQPQFLGNVFKS